MAYCNMSDVQVYINGPDLLAATDDNQTGNPADPGVLGVQATILDLVSADIDGRIANIYNVPLIPAPPTLRAACAVFAAEALYNRRLVPGTKNPMDERAKMWRDRLTLIGNGKLELDLRYSRDFPQGVVIQCPIAVNTNTM